MNALLVLLLLGFADAPTVDVGTLSLKRVRGELVSADAKQWKIRRDGKEEVLPVDEVLNVEVVTGTKPAKATGSEVGLLDGSMLQATQVTLEGNSLTAENPGLGARKFARSSLSSIRFVPAGAQEQAWRELLVKERKQDLLVVKKNDVLDFVEGVISKITATDVVVLLDGDPVTLKREKVFGVILFQRNAATKTAPGLVELTSGDKLAAQQVTSDAGQITVKLAAGDEIKVPLEAVQRIDLSRAKVWLSDLKPRDIKHEDVFIDKWREYNNDKDIYGGPLVLGDAQFHRGVCIRSKTSLRYRLEGDYARFKSWMGIQKGFNGDVHVELSLDGAKVFEADVAPGKPAVPIDLDVSGKFVLEVLVDYGTNQDDQGDHLVLGHARLTK